MPEASGRARVTFGCNRKDSGESEPLHTQHRHTVKSQVNI